MDDQIVIKPAPEQRLVYTGMDGEAKAASLNRCEQALRLYDAVEALAEVTMFSLDNIAHGTWTVVRQLSSDGDQIESGASPVSALEAMLEAIGEDEEDDALPPLPPNAEICVGPPRDRCRCVMVYPDPSPSPPPPVPDPAPPAHYLGGWGIPRERR